MRSWCAGACAQISATRSAGVAQSHSTGCASLGADAGSVVAKAKRSRRSCSRRLSALERLLTTGHDCSLRAKSHLLAALTLATKLRGMRRPPFEIRSRLTDEVLDKLGCGSCPGDKRGVGIGLAARLTAAGLARFAGLFVVIWWVWLTFTVYTARFGTCDAFHRAPILLAMLVTDGLAASVPGAFVGRTTPFAVAYALLKGEQLVLFERARRQGSAGPSAVRPARARRTASAGLRGAILAATVQRLIVVTASSSLEQSFRCAMLACSAVEPPTLLDGVAGGAAGMFPISWHQRQPTPSACWAIK